MLTAADLSPKLRRQYGLAAPRTRRTSRLGKITRDINAAQRKGTWTTKEDQGIFELELDVRLLTANELLQPGGRALSAYRLASHRAVRDTVIATLNRIPAEPLLSAPCRLKIWRRAPRLVDNDALGVMFKFLLDGLRHANVIADDDPAVLTNIRPRQMQGRPRIRMTVSGPLATVEQRGHEHVG